MRIAFDLDDTLIPCRYVFPVEKPKRSFFARFLGYEPLRQGTRELVNFCRQQHCQVWVYTTSYRSPLYIRRLFWLYGIRLDGVVNQAIHDKKVTVRSTKHPPTFGIDWLIDDSEGVKREGERYHFRTLCIAPSDRDWVATIQSQLRNPGGA